MLFVIFKKFRTLVIACTSNVAILHMLLYSFRTVYRSLSAVRLTQKLPTKHALETSFKLWQITVKSRYAMIKQLGHNSSQIDSIDIGHGKAGRLQTDQVLHIVDMKYPHKITYTGQNSEWGETKVKSKHKLTRSEQESHLKTKSQKLDTVDDAKSQNIQMKTSVDDTETTKNDQKSEISQKTPHWSIGLKSSMKDPDLVVFKDDKVVVIKDKYPKAKYHWLVMPVENLTNTTQLRSSHLSLLEHMLKIGKKMIKDKVDDNDRGKAKFRYGYHAVHSMSHLHMHVISQDFDSSSLKTKKHWNSFTTEYFVDADVIIAEVEADGKVKNRRHMTELLKEPLRCHICKTSLKNMPLLKRHIVECE